MGHGGGNSVGKGSRLFVAVWSSSGQTARRDSGRSVDGGKTVPHGYMSIPGPLRPVEYGI